MKKTISTYFNHRIHAMAIAISMLLGFPACGGGKKDMVTPPEVLIRDSMVQVMATIHIAEARIMQANDQQLKQSVKSNFVLESLNKHQVDTALFNRSFDWYASHPEMFSELYDDVLSEISRRQAEANDK